MRKPLILIPSATDPERGARYYANTAYVQAVEDAGGIPIITGRPIDDADLDGLIGIADGLFLVGGLDTEPPRYGKNHCKHVVHVDAERDTLEMALLARAEKKIIPIFGICRGLQMMNIHAGGTLFRDIADERPNSLRHECHDNPDRSFIAHDVSITEGSVLSTTLGCAEIGVNSLHHQGVDKLGDGIHVSATSSDGLVEAIERPLAPFWVAVQWHPEELTDPVWKNLFASFVSAAKK